MRWDTGGGALGIICLVALAYIFFICVLSGSNPIEMLN